MNRGGSMIRSTRGFVLALVLLLPLAVQARDTEVFVAAESAAQSDHAKGYLLDVPWYLKDQPGAPQGRSLATVTTEQSTRGAFRSDESSCQVAFLTALKNLQERAQRMGGDAVVDIVSVTRGSRSESPTDFRCVAGAIVVHVGLEGTIVDLD